MRTARCHSGGRRRIIRPRSFFFCGFWAALLCICIGLPAAVRAGIPAEDGSLMALSYSGQFVVTGTTEKSPLLSLPAVTTNASFVRLDPAVLSVSAERIKESLYRLLAVPPGRRWQGKIYLAVHPALWTDEDVTVVSRPIDGSWSYLVQLPDVVEQSRFMRGMVGALLQELANRAAGADGHAAEIPPWLMEGLAQQLAQDELAKVVLSSPDQPFGGPPARAAAARERNLDSLAGARAVLRKFPALTFDQLSWPTAEQLAGEDGGIYAASAQLFVADWLKLNGGAAQLRTMLQNLPHCYNWQTAFENSCRSRFPAPVDLEKWWALDVVNFLAHDPGPAWTPSFSERRLEELLLVPVEVRMSSNALPSHAEIPLQAVIHDFGPAQQAAIFETHLRDLRIAQLRMAPQFIALTDDYCRVLAGYLGERLAPPPRQPSFRRVAASPVRLPAREVIKRLDALDARRRALEAALQPHAIQTSARGGPPGGMAGLTGLFSIL